MTSRKTETGDSKSVTSNQTGLHPNLARVVRRHLASPHLARVSEHSISAYKELRQRLDDFDGQLVLDSFCGTGHSTNILAQRHSGHLVAGIDKSAHRLAKHPFTPGHNTLLLRANCEEIWKLLADDGIRLKQHYLLYPNPWPKSGQLQRRIHGHPGFPLLKELGGVLQLRSNWQLYVEEFGTAMNLAGVRGAVFEIGTNEGPVTLFEKKYRDSGHTLWAYHCVIENESPVCNTPGRGKASP